VATSHVTEPEGDSVKPGVMYAAAFFALAACVPEVPVGGTVPLPSGTGGGSFVISNGSTTGGGLWGGTLTFDAEGRLTDYLDSAGWSLTGGTVSEFDADGIVAWGRWTSGTGSGSGAPFGGGSVTVLQYAVAEVTPDLPTISTLARSYTSFDSTRPTVENGGVITTGTVDGVTGTLALDNAANTVSYALTIVVGLHTFSLSGTGTFVSPGTTDVRILGGGTVTSSSGDVSGGWTGLIPYGPLFQAVVYGADGGRVVGNFAFTSDIGTVSGTVVFK
jgi:hypothetical protein